MQKYKGTPNKTTGAMLNKPITVMSAALISKNAICRLTKKAEPPPTRDVNRDSGTDSANGG
jgi:hypothetical protein